MTIGIIGKAREAREASGAFWLAERQEKMIPVSVKKELEKNGWKRVCKYDKQEEFFLKGFWCIKDSRGKTDIYKGWNLHTETGILYLSNIPANKLLDFARQCN